MTDFAASPPAPASGPDPNRSTGPDHTTRSLRHELRTPLHAILGFAELLGGRNLDDEARRDLDQIRAAARRLQAIVDAIP